MKNIMPKDKKKLAYEIAIGAALILFIIFVYMPQHHKVSKLKSQSKETEKQIEMSKAMLGDLNKLGHVLAQMQQELAAFEKRIPDTKHMSHILSEVPTMAKASNIEVISIKPQKPVQLLDKDRQPLTLNEMPLMKIEVDLGLRASYRDLAEYIKKIQESLKILATINEITVSKGEGVEPLLEANLILTAYVIDKG